MSGNETMSSYIAQRIAKRKESGKHVWGDGKAASKQAAWKRSVARAAGVAAMRGVRSVPAYNTGSKGELKSWDAEVGDSTCVLVGDVAGAGPAANNLIAGMVCLNIITQGSAVNNRIGNKINITSIRCRFDIGVTLVPWATYNTVRYMVIYDRQCNGAYPAITDILRSNDTSTQHYSSMSIANRDRFVCLREGTTTCDTAHQQLSQFDLFIKCRLQSQYKASTAGNLTIGDIATGAVYFIVFGALHAGPVQATIYNFSSRVRYVD